MIRWFVLLCLLMPTVAMAGPGRGRGGPGGPGAFDPKMLAHAADMLDLDEKTRAQVKDLVYESEKESIGLHARLKTARLELHRALDAEAPDRASVMKGAEQVGQLKIELQKHRFGLMLDVRRLLTAEQVRKLKSMRHELREQRRERRKHRRRGRRGPPESPQPPDPPSDD